MPDIDRPSNSMEIKSRGSTGSWKLRAVQPDGAVTELFLIDGLTIGRSNANSIQACDDDSGTVERSHARVDFENDGAVVLKCLREATGVETTGGTVPTLRLAIGSTFRIGRTHFEVVAGPTAEQASIASAGRGCPYCGQADLPEVREVPTQCPGCGKPIVVVSPDHSLGVPTFLPGVFRDDADGEYPVERFVARGGMGYVLKGMASQGWPVAIKVLIFDGNTNAQAITRFKQEIDLLRKLNDPNVLRLITHGQEAGVFFFAMEWVDGHDLRSVLPTPARAETYPDFSEALRWFEQACEGLSAIHRAGAVHRDIKPSNLLLNREGKLLIADLGVAKRLNESETGMTCTGQMPGTYWYMAPEQLYAPDLVDQRSDIYSLAFTFWELLTGTKPNVVGLQPPSAVNPTVPKEFDEILLAMLASRMEDRPATMLEVLRSLPRPSLRPTAPRHVERPASSSTVDGDAHGKQPLPSPVPRDVVSTPRQVPAPTSQNSEKTPDYIDHVARSLRRLDALAKAGLSWLREWTTRVIRDVTKRIERVRQASALSNAASTPSSPSGPGSAPSAVTTPSGSSGSIASSRLEVMPTHIPEVTIGEAAPAGGAYHEPDARNAAAAIEAEAAKVRDEIQANLQAAVSLVAGSDEQLDALKAVRRALTLVPADLRTPQWDQDLRPLIDKHLGAALRRRADDAFARRQYGVALDAYEELRRVSLADDLVADRVEHMLAIRRSALAKATETMRLGQLSQARDQIAELQKSFSGYAGFGPECEQLLTKTRLVEQRVKETIPALRVTKNLFRMREMLESLAADGIAIAGLAELLEKTRSTISEGSRRLEGASLFLAQGRVDAVRRAIAEVRNVVADHPDADELSGKVDAEELRQNRVVQESRKLAEAGRLLRVHRILRSEPAAQVNRLGVADLFREASAYRRRSDRFVRLLLWCIGGTGIVVLAPYLSSWIWHGIEGIVRRIPSLGDALVNSTLCKALPFAIFAAIAYAAFYALREAVNRGGKSRYVLPDAIVLCVMVAILAVVDVGLKTFAQVLADKGGAAGIAVILTAGQWLTVVAVAAVYSTVIATFVRFGVDVAVPQAIVILRPAIIFGGALAAFGVFAPLGIVGGMGAGHYDSSRPLPGFVVSTLLAMAAAGMVAQVRPIGIRVWPVVAGGAAFLAARGVGVSSVVGWSGVSVAWAVTLAIGVFLGLERRSWWNGAVAIAIACAAIATTGYVLGLSGYPENLAAILSWAVACVVVVGIAQPHIVRRLDFRDRCAELFAWFRSPPVTQPNDPQMTEG
jgi:serine/threonine protein kinase